MCYLTNGSKKIPGEFHEDDGCKGAPFSGESTGFVRGTKKVFKTIGFSCVFGELQSIKKENVGGEDFPRSPIIYYKYYYNRNSMLTAK